MRTALFRFIARPQRWTISFAAAIFGYGIGAFFVASLPRPHLPYLKIIAGTSVFAGAAALLMLSKRYGPRISEQRRLAAGLCPGCGYDLRASKERCPECGRVIMADDRGEP